MINKDRIVPVTKTDLLTLYGIILKQDSNNSSLAKLASSDVEGDFAIASAGTYIADQPLKSGVFGAAVTSGSIFFVAAYDYEGFTKTGATLTVSGPSGGVVADGATLYKATISTNALTIAKVGI